MEELIAVESSNISAVGWKEGNLTVRFKNGAVYQYKEVPELLYQDLLNSVSKGKFFRDNIQGNYPFEKADVLRESK